MKQKFEIGQNSLEAIQTIIQNQPIIKSLTVISHKISKNWRQIHTEANEKIKHIEESLEHVVPIETKVYLANNLCKISLEKLPKLRKDEVWSITSKVTCHDNVDRHIPFMNFHPIDISFDELQTAINVIRPNMHAAMLSTDRFYHYYENDLLTKEEWIKFMANFLMPCVLVSPRYIGHRLYDGYGTLRLTKAKELKIKQPTVISIF